jgi:hypothetical protein
VREPEEISQVAQEEGKTEWNNTRKHDFFYIFFIFISEILLWTVSMLQKSGFCIIAKTALSTV